MDPGLRRGNVGAVFIRLARTRRRRALAAGFRPGTNNFTSRLVAWEPEGKGKKRLGAARRDSESVLRPCSMDCRPYILNVLEARPSMIPREVRRGSRPSSGASRASSRDGWLGD